MAFTKAVKRDAKGRVALIGPAGSGKSFTMLTLARALAGPTGKIAAIDTEHGSLSKYADLFDFDVVELDSFSPQTFLEALTEAERGGYAVFCADSLSHFWMGKDGALEFVDNAAKRSQSRDGMAGWKDFRPHERAMIDRMIASPCHVICTMRTKTAYEEQVNERTGKKQRVKIGLAPVQREGLEFEFDVVGAMDEDNTLVIDKTRCPQYTGKALSKPGAKDFELFIDWLKGEPVEQTQNPPQPEVPAAVQAYWNRMIVDGKPSKQAISNVLAEQFEALESVIGTDEANAEYARIQEQHGRPLESLTFAKRCCLELDRLIETRRATMEVAA